MAVAAEKRGRARGSLLSISYAGCGGDANVEYGQGAGTIGIVAHDIYVGVRQKGPKPRSMTNAWRGFGH